ncbi:MAG: class I SAM-dependent methyltransferase [Leptolyngbyaceae cyanobacterium]
MATEPFFELLNVPIYCNLLWSDQQAARNCPKGDIKLAFHADTGLITNVAFDPDQLGYDQDYENSLHYSPRFQAYAQTLAADLVERHRLYGKRIIEIGCGKGDFLISLCQLGQNQGIGFDPSYVPRPEHESRADQVQFIQDYYSTHYANYQADFICCRHMLEHVPYPTDLLRSVRQALGDRLDTILFFEVPNAAYTFRHLAIWDIIYEHCCYFVEFSLAQAFIRSGFQVERTYTTFNDQFLCLEARPVQESTHIGSSQDERSAIAALKTDLVHFNTQFQTKIHAWEDAIAQLSAKRQRVVVWGAGSKGVTFLNLLQNPASVDYVTDINLRKQGKYIAGTGQEIVPPDSLRNYQPDIIIIMNPIYQDEIQSMTVKLALEPEFICA